ncbi:MAG TPA: segregation/condensation protein A [Puia sp.]|nr:segregation/condensation protein A [Puia sp.]
MNNTTYQIKLPQFEGPFDLLLFFIERDELDIYNIPISKIIQDFLTYIHSQEHLNIELSSEFILFVSTLMRVKAKMLLPRKELDEQGNEIDPRQELIDKLLEYKRYKEAAATLAEMEAIRHLMVRRGNLQKELAKIGEESGEGTEIQAITLFKLMKTFERLMQRIQQRQNKPVHTVVQYRYTMEGSREYMLVLVEKERTLSFEKIFDTCENRLHAIFTFLSMLELVQAKYFNILIGEGRNNFIVEWNENRSEDEDSPFAVGGEEEGEGPQSALGHFEGGREGAPEFRFGQGGDEGAGPDEEDGSGGDQGNPGDQGDRGRGSGFFDDEDRALLN